MIASDFVLNLGWGLLGPVFAIFIVQNITTGSTAEAAKIAGFASLFYWVTKAIFQIPIGRYLDKNHGEKDDFWFMVMGTFIAGFIPLGYLFAFAPWHIYLLQMIYAFGMSMMVVTPPAAAAMDPVRKSSLCINPDLAYAHVYQPTQAIRYSPYSQLSDTLPFRYLCQSF